MLDPVDEGSIEWRGQAIAGNAVPGYRKQVTYLHQRSALWDGTVEENLRLPFTLQTRAGEHFDRGRVLALLDVLGRDQSFLAKSSRELSAGEGQIVALVRALQLEPSVLLLDEPTASLDPQTAAAAEGLIDQWLKSKARERALIWVGHDLEQTLRMTRRQLTLRAGRLESEKSGE